MPKKVSKKGKNDKLSEKVNSLEDQLKMALADYRNLSRRVEEKQLEWRIKSVSRIVDKLLEVYDDLCRAKNHFKDKGLAMTVNQFWSVLESEGVSKIKTKKMDFDPELMDCTEVVAGPENKVVETVSKGYCLNGEVIRPARVKVGKGN